VKERSIFRSAALAVGLIPALLACERPPVEAVQGDYRGLGVEQVSNPRAEQAKLAANQVPETIPPVEGRGPLASEIYQNVQVLGDLHVNQFARVMDAMTQWVSPEQGCDYCHGSNLASDDKYTKVVSRRMLQMTQYINQDWKQHVGATGVTCYTCHRGQNIPADYWVMDPGVHGAPGQLGQKAGQNMPASTVGGTSLPHDPFSPFLSGDQDIRIQSDDALPAGNRRSIKQAEWTYGLMMHLSTSLGVNCTYCHNSRAFKSWEQSSPRRVVAWNAIRMVRDLNQDYMTPLASVFPAHRKGPLGDTFKINCATCHQGLPKPLMGVSMAKDYPSLQKITTSTAAGGASGMAPATPGASEPAARSGDAAQPPASDEGAAPEPPTEGAMAPPASDGPEGPGPA